MRISSEITFSGAFTVSFWINGSSQTDDYKRILNSSSVNETNIILADTDNRLYIRIEGGWHCNINDVLTGNWYHIVYTRDASDNLKGYKNAGTPTTDSKTGDYKFSDMGGYGASSNWEGKMDEVAVWNTDLDADAVTAIYNSGTPIALDADSGNYSNSSNLQGWWRMGDGDLDDGNIAGNGLIADQSAPSALGSELLTATNWTTASGWGLSGGILTYNDSENGGTTLSASNMTNGTGMAIGKVYKLQYTIGSLSSGTATIIIHDSDGNIQVAEASEANGSYTKYFSATNDGKGFKFNALLTSGSSFTVTDYSLKQVTGNPGVMVSMASTLSTDVPPS